MKKRWNVAAILLLSLMLTGISWAGPYLTTYQAKIIKPDGYPLEASSVNFRFTVLDSVGSCVLYVEDYAAVNMNQSGGLISFSLGNGARSFPASGTAQTFQNTFDNSVPAFSCQMPGIYNPGPNDTRKVVMQFNDGSGWQTLPAMTINAVPYAMYANKSTDAKALNGKADTAFVEYSTLAALNCQTNEAIKFNGVSFSCIPVGAGSSGITGVTTSGTVLSTGGTASAPVISIQAATMSQDGYLTSLDYAEFKAKLSASSTQIVNTLGFAPVSSSAVATQINNSNLSGDVSGTVSSNSVVSVGGKTASQISTSVDATLAATTSATADTIVKRNSSGNVTVNDVYANAAKINYADIYKPSTNFSIRLQAPNSLAANYTLTLPNTAGVSGQVISTDGAGNLSWMNPSTGSVVSVSASAPLVSTGGSTPTISITQATSSTNGYLTSADWNTFNNKQSSQWTTSGTNIYYSTGNVGVGTSSPVTKLHVQSNISNYIFSESTDAGTNAGFAMKNNSRQWNIWVNAASNDSFQISDVNNSTTPLSIDSSGNVGIRTASPTARLHLVAGTSSTAPLKLTSGTLLTSAQAGAIEYNGSDFYFTDGASTRRSLSSIAGNAVTSSSVVSALGYTPADSANVTSLQSSTAASFAAITSSQWVTSGTDISYNTGNVNTNSITASGGVFATQENGWAIHGSMTYGASTSPHFIGYRARGTKASPSYPLINDYLVTLSGRDAIDTATNTASISFLAAENFSATTKGSKIYFATTPVGSAAAATRMIITDLGYVGIGTTGPIAPLHVNASTGSPTLYLQNTSTNMPYLQFQNGGFIQDIGSPGSLRMRAPSSGILVFDTNGANERLRITSTGYFGVGTTAPQNKFHINESGANSTVIQFTNSDTGQADGFAGARVGISSDEYASLVGGSNTNGVKLWSNNIARMTLDNNGNFGFGTVSPTHVVDIVDDGNDAGMKFTGFSNSYAADFRIFRARGTKAGPSALLDTDVIGGLQFYGYGAATAPTQRSAAIEAVAVENYSASARGADLVFKVAASGTTSAVEAMRIANSGKIGIGTTNPQAKIDIDGALFLGVSGDVTVGADIKMGQQGLITAENNFYLNTDSDNNGSGDFLFSKGSETTSGAVSLMTIKNSGNVGVGTTSPARKLSVTNSNSTAYTSTGTAPSAAIGLLLENPSTTNATTFIDMSVNGGNGVGRAFIGALYSGWAVANPPPNIVFGTTKSTYTEQMALAGMFGTLSVGYPASSLGGLTPLNSVLVSGSIGIGSLTPSARLHISGVNQNAASSPLFRITDTSLTNSYFAIDNGVSANDYRIISSGSSPKNMEFQTGAFSNQFVLNTNGNVGVNTASPVSKLTVNGTQSAINDSGLFLVNDESYPNDLTTGRPGVSLGYDNANDWGWIYSRRAGKAARPFYINGTVFVNPFNGAVGIGTTAPGYTLDVNGSIAAVGALQAHSDRRLKKNIVSIDKSLEKLNAIEGVYYDWKKEEFPNIHFDDKHQMGVIAQDVEKVFPEAVSESKSTGLKSVAYTMLVAPMINAIKELYHRWLDDSEKLHQALERQSREISSLKEENAELKAYLCDKDPTAPICK